MELKQKTYVLILAGLLLLQPLFDIWTYWVLEVKAPNYVAVIRALFVLIFFLIVLLISRFDWRMLAISAVYAAFIVLIYLLSESRLPGSGLDEAEKAFKVYLMPLTMLYFIWYARRHEKLFVQTVWRVMAAIAVISYSVALLAVLTGTNRPTYDKNWIQIGLNGWFYSGNAQSIVLFTVTPFLVAGLLLHFGKKPSLTRLIYFLTAAAAGGAVLYFNGTRVAYIGLFVTFGPLFVLWVIKQWQARTLLQRNVPVYGFLVAAMVASVVLFPFSITYAMMNARGFIVDRYEQNRPSQTTELTEPSDTTEPSESSGSNQPTTEPTTEEEEVVITWLRRFIPAKEIDADLAMGFYKMIQHAPTSQLTDVRFIQRTFVEYTMARADMVQTLFGYGSAYYPPYVNDLESDYAAIYGFYGWVGLFLFFAPILALVILLLQNLVRLGLKRILTIKIVLPIMLAVCHFGVAALAGRILQQASTSIYISLMLALAYITTCDELKVTVPVLFRPDSQVTT